MKLQIISRLTQNQNYCKPYSLHTSTIRQQPQNHQNNLHHQYYSTNLQPHHHISTKKMNDKNIQSFFNDFNSNCTVIYESLTKTNQHRKVKRSLQPQLEIIKLFKENKSHNVQQVTFSKPLSKVSMDDDEMKAQKYHRKVQERRNYYYLKDQTCQKIRKINSLISINNKDHSQQTQNNKRKPGFIKRIKSLSKHSISNQNTNHSRPTSSSYHYDSNQISYSNTMNESKHHIKASSYESVQGIQKYDDEMKQSKDRIAKIRRQLNNIYQMKCKQSFKLKLN